MKKSIVVIVLVLAASALFATGVAFAQSPQPFQPVNGAGRGTGDGPLHEYMTNAMAQALGITPADFEARRLAGQTAYQIALDLGISADKIRALLSEARANALDAAAAAGAITQQQADWMSSRGNRMGAGSCDGTGQQTGQANRMGRGGWRFQQSNP